MTSHLGTADPAHFAGSASPDGSPPRIALRCSLTLRWVTAAFILIAAATVVACAAPRLGVWLAFPPALAVFALLAISALAWERRQPRELKIGANGLSLWKEAGGAPVQARITGCSQWSDRLLILALAGESGRLNPLFIAADALPADVFRELSVLGRRGSPTSL
ncbi:protein YgfX [Paraburkholderia sp. GAS42]|uniref:protein YgfX n=1 Tax=Paraburkholderia sp. GAS42 TaxID=3035135 RepID=UPI003D21FE60